MTQRSARKANKAPKPPKPYAKTVAAIKRNRTKKLASLVTHSIYLHRRKQDEKMYNLICEEFVSLGGVYVKFLQGVMLRTQVMRKWHNPEKLKIFENLDSEPLNIGAILQHELPPEKLAMIAQIQPLPFAAGSFGQVYYGQLRDGQPIIVKVLRPMVRELLQYDIKLLSTFSKTFFVKLYKNVNMQMKEAIEEFKTATLRETDYRHEAAFAREMYEAYKNHPKIMVPQTYLELCTDNIIVQDFVDGISVAQLVRMKDQGYDPVAYVKETLGSDLVEQMETFGYESLMAIFNLRRVQGDPHPGNVRVMTDNRVGLIDFGISAQAPEEKGALFGMLETYNNIFNGSQTAVDLFEQGLRFFVSDLYRSLKKLTTMMGQKNDKDYLSEVSGVAAKVFQQATGSDIINADMKSDTSILGVINKLVNRGNRFGLIMKLEATDILRGIQTYTAMVASLGLYEEVMPKILDRAIVDIKRMNPEVGMEKDDHIGMADAIEVVSKWLERVAERDPALFRSLMRGMNMKNIQGNLPIEEAKGDA